MTYTLALGLSAILVALLVTVPIVRRQKRPVRRSSGPAGRTSPAPTAPEGVPPARPASGRIEGRVREGSMKTVGDIVDRHPGEAVSVLRRWIRADDPDS